MSDPPTTPRGRRDRSRDELERLVRIDADDRDVEVCEKGDAGKRARVEDEGEQGRPPRPLHRLRGVEQRADPDSRAVRTSYYDT